MYTDRNPPINIGILAHVDGGKTTLSEQMLFLSGAIRSMGRVDEGSAHTDFMEIERTRGISIRSASAFFTWKGQDVNLIDTPGHSDFSGEVQRAIRAMDMAVLVVSAVEGVQSQTELIWKALRRIGVPVVLFINKTDRPGSNVENVIREINDIFGIMPAAWIADDRELRIEAIAETDDLLLEKYLEHGVGSISAEDLSSALLKEFYSCRFTPYLTGSALKGEGVYELLDLIASLAKNCGDLAGQEFSAVIFKLEHDNALGRVAYVRLFSGLLKNRDIIHNATSGTDEKVVQIRKIQGAKDKDIGLLSAGDIGAVYGLSSARNGDVLGDASMVPGEVEFAAPMLRVKIYPKEEKNYSVLAVALEQLSAEDPMLDMIWQKESHELIVRVTGLIQIEILKALLKERFDLNVMTDEPQVIYKERPRRYGEGYVEYTMPKPCWAIMRFAIEPLPIGKGVVFESAVSNDKIYERYQAQVRQVIPEALKQGPKGWEVTDIKIKLIDGEHHIVHTHPLDFIVAAPMGIMDGLVNSGTDLLEPMLKFKLSFPEEHNGKIIGEIIAMRGSFESPVIHRGIAAIEGRLPLAESMDFPIRLSSLTGGRGFISTFFDGYEICPPGKGLEISYRGVSPIDRAKYILSKRGALSVKNS